MGVSLSRLQNASFQTLFSSEATMQAQHYAKTKMDYLVFNGYNSLINQSKTAINNSDFKDEVDIGSISTDANGISYRTVKVSVYKSDEALPRASLEQVFYSNDANKYVRNGSSATSNISLNYDKDNDRLYAMVDGEEKSLSGGGGVPIGTVIAWPSNTAPIEDGVWLECNGQSCADYPKLIAVLGKTTVPNYKGRFLETDSVAGVVKEPGLPNILGVTSGIDLGRVQSTINPEYYNNAFYGISETYFFVFFNDHVATYEFPHKGSIASDIQFFYNVAGKDGYYGWPAIAEQLGGFDASRCSSIYKNNFETVQPASVTVRRFIKAA